MRFLAEILAFSASVAAQDIAFDEIPDAPTPFIPLGEGIKSTILPYNPTAVIQDTVASILSNPPDDLITDTDTASASQKRSQDSGLSRRGWECSLMDVGAGPTPSPDDASTFVNWTYFADQSTNAPTPAGWTNVFTNLQGESQTSAYLGYVTLPSYNTTQCAAACTNVNGCISFNMAFERSPTAVPGTNCTNPPSTTMIKCVFWGTFVSAATATNTGQWRSDFHVVVAGSNGYVKTMTPGGAPPVPVPGYGGLILGGASINAPPDCNGRNTYLTYTAFTDGQPFDANRCAAACRAVTQYSMTNLGGRDVCRAFVTYILLKNDNPQGQICAMYNTTWSGVTNAVNTGYWDGSDHYTIGYSQSFFNTSDPGSPVCPADITYLQNSPDNQAFCSSYINYTPPVTTVSVVSIITAPATATPAPVRKRDAVVRNAALQTPASLATWPATKISSACSMIATGTVTSTTITATTTVFV